MTVLDDLIAAKALIDTPEKWTRSKGMLGALRAVCGGDNSRCDLANRALGAAAPHKNPASRRFASESRQRLRHPPSVDQEHPDIMALFDRAIAASEPHP